jgi:general secretion pathway protein I
MSRERGFTLIEVLVAFAIAALAVTVLFKGIGAGVGTVRTAGHYEEAVSRAESHLAAIGHSVDIAAGELQGDDGSGYHWRIKIAPLATSKMPSGDPDVNQPAPPQPIILYGVTVAISWKEDGRQREVKLQTQRLGVGASNG